MRASLWRGLSKSLAWLLGTWSPPRWARSLVRLLDDLLERLRGTYRRHPWRVTLIVFAGAAAVTFGQRAWQTWRHRPLPQRVTWQTSAGATGVGKDLVARCLHDFGRRAKANYVAVNCAAVPETMVESEFFGHEAGAFTSASKHASRFHLLDLSCAVAQSVRQRIHACTRPQTEQREQQPSAAAGSRAAPQH
jgi:hypothetical protein